MADELTCDWFEGNHVCGQPAKWIWRGSYTPKRGLCKTRTWERHYCHRHYLAFEDPLSPEWEAVTHHDNQQDER